MKTKALRGVAAFLWSERWIRFSTKNEYPLSTALFMPRRGSSTTCAMRSTGSPKAFSCYSAGSRFCLTYWWRATCVPV
jgi:hypothetical protein